VPPADSLIVTLSHTAPSKEDSWKPLLTSTLRPVLLVYLRTNVMFPGNRTVSPWNPQVTWSMAISPCCARAATGAALLQR